MGSNSKKNLISRISRDKEARETLVDNNLSQGIAFQIAATRDAQGMTQAELAERAGVSNNFPRLEDPEYGKHTISTLKKIAFALDVALVVRLVPFSQYIDWLSGTPHLDQGIRPEALAVPCYEQEITKGVFETNTQYWPVITPSVEVLASEAQTGRTAPFEIQRISPFVSKIQPDEVAA